MLNNGTDFLAVMFPEMVMVLTSQHLGKKQEQIIVPAKSPGIPVIRIHERRYQYSELLQLLNSH